MPCCDLDGHRYTAVGVGGLIRGTYRSRVDRYMQTGKTMKGKLAYFNRRGNRLG